MVEELVELLEHLDAWLICIFQLLALALGDLVMLVLDVFKEV
jgi:hypothetical protein